MSDVRHLSDHQISASVDGVLQGSSQEQVVRHLAECAECRAHYEELVEHHQTLATLLAHDPDDAFFSALEADVERALVTGDGSPRSATVSIRSGPSRSIVPVTPRPTLGHAISAIGPKPAWAPAESTARPTPPLASAPPSPLAPAEPASPAAQRPPLRIMPAPAAPSAASPVARPVAPTPAMRLAPRPASVREPEPQHVFPDEIYEADSEDEAMTEAAGRQRRSGPARGPMLAIALAAVAIAVVAILAVVLIRRGDEARTASESRATVASTVTVADPVPAPATVPVAGPGTPGESAAVAPPAAKPVRQATAPEATAKPAAPATKTAKSEPTSRPKPTPARAAAPAGAGAVAGAEQSAARLCGDVRNLSGEPIAHAQVLVTGLTLGAISDEAGHFCLTLPPGDYELRVSALGHAPTAQPISARSGMEPLGITLRPIESTPE